MSNRQTATESFRPDVFTTDPPALLGILCPHCSRKSFPTRENCPFCGADQVDTQVRLSPSGRIYSYTIVRQAPPGRATPYALAYIDLPADDIRVLAPVISAELDAIRIGDHVTLVAVQENSAPTTFAFRLLHERQA